MSIETNSWCREKPVLSQAIRCYLSIISSKRDWKHCLFQKRRIQTAGLPWTLALSWGVCILWFEKHKSKDSLLTFSKSSQHSAATPFQTDVVQATPYWESCAAALVVQTTMINSRCVKSKLLLSSTNLQVGFRFQWFPMSKDQKEEGGAKDNRITYQPHGMPCTVEESFFGCIPFKVSQRCERPEKMALS